MKSSTEQLNRIKRDWELLSQDNVVIEQINSTIYGFTSELGTLRLLAVYRNNDSFRHGYSKNMNSHFASLDI